MMSSTKLLEDREQIEASLRAAIHATETGTETVETRISPARKALREAASVLGPFDPDELLAPPRKTARKARKILARAALIAEDCSIVSQGRWILDTKVRRSVLGEMLKEGRLSDALERTSHFEDDPYRAIFVEIATGKLRPLEERALAELRDLKQVLTWLGEHAPVPFDLAEIDERMEYQYLVDPFRRLGQHFHGRQSEVVMLRDFVELYEGSDLTEQAYRGVKNLFGIEKRRPQVVWGPGGIGKSALIGRFILDHIEAGSAGDLAVSSSGKIPFAYLDFDKVALDPLRPETLYLEIASQLVQQYDDSELEKIVAEWARIIRQRERRGPRTGPRGPRLASVRSDKELAEHMINTFEMWSRRVLLEGNDLPPPFLLVLDTFEEVQLGGEARERRLAEFIENFTRRYPRLRVVICGRAKIRFLDAAHHHLDELEPSDADEVLKDHGVESAKLRSMVIDRVGTNPLSLILAAEAVRSGDLAHQNAVLDDLKLRKNLFQRIDATEIQGQLYDRVLKHIRDLRLRRLAHPGLVVRRITVDVIREILAEPCGLDPNDADELFEILGRNFSLVDRNPDGSLQHRRDVRSLMLRNMLNGTQYRATMQAIHRSAARYYAEKVKAGPINLGELIYHRLMLGDLGPDLEKLAMEVNRGSLELAWQDPLPAASRAWLAQFLGYESSEIDWDEVELEAWERHVAVRAEELLAANEPKRALSRLRERKARSPGSPLYALEATTLEALGRPEAALKVVQTGLETEMPSSQTATALALYQKAATLSLQLHKPRLFNEYLERGGELAALEGNKAAQLFFATLRHRWYESTLQSEYPGKKGEKATEELIQMFLSTPREVLQAEPQLAGNLLEDVGVYHPTMLAHAINVIKPAHPGPKGASLVASVLEHADNSEDFRQRKDVLFRQMGISDQDASWDSVASRAIEYGTLDQALHVAVKHGSLSDEDMASVASIVKYDML